MPNMPTIRPCEIVILIGECVGDFSSGPTFLLRAYTPVGKQGWAGVTRKAGKPSCGHYDYFPIDGGETAPLYLVVFDKNGLCQSPLTLEKFVEEANSGRYTDVHVFSHGWNNVFKDALQLYREFFNQYFALLEKYRLHRAY